MGEEDGDDCESSPSLGFLKHCCGNKVDGKKLLTKLSFIHQLSLDVVVLLFPT